MVLLVLLYHGVRVSIITVFELYCTVLYGMIQCDFLENLRWLMMLVMWVTGDSSSASPVRSLPWAWFGCENTYWCMGGVVWLIEKTPSYRWIIFWWLGRRGFEKRSSKLQRRERSGKRIQSHTATLYSYSATRNSIELWAIIINNQIFFDDCAVMGPLAKWHFLVCYITRIYTTLQYIIKYRIESTSNWQCIDINRKWTSIRNRSISYVVSNLVYHIFTISYAPVVVPYAPWIKNQGKQPYTPRPWSSTLSLLDRHRSGEACIRTTMPSQKKSSCPLIRK